jgi:hypothetical protein
MAIGIIIMIAVALFYWWSPEFRFVLHKLSIFLGLA